MTLRLKGNVTYHVGVGWNMKKWKRSMQEADTSYRIRSEVFSSFYKKKKEKEERRYWFEGLTWSWDSIGTKKVIKSQEYDKQTKEMRGCCHWWNCCSASKQRKSMEVFIYEISELMERRKKKKCLMGSLDRGQFIRLLHTQVKKKVIATRTFYMEVICLYVLNVLTRGGSFN